MNWNMIIESFNIIYLNWNPSIYPFRKTINSRWSKGNP